MGAVTKAGRWELEADALEKEAWRRAVKGRLEPLFYGGKKCGRVRKYSDTLLMFLLRAAKPERYGDRRKAEPDGKAHEDWLEDLEAGNDGE